MLWNVTAYHWHGFNNYCLLIDVYALEYCCLSLSTSRYTTVNLFMYRYTFTCKVYGYVATSTKTRNLMDDMNDTVVSGISNFTTMGK